MALGDIIFRGASLWLRLVGNTTTTRKFLAQTGTGSVSAAPSWLQVTDADLSVSDVTTNNVTTSAHGFVPKAPNSTSQFLRGDATWSALPGGATVTYVRKSADESVTSSTALQSDDALLFAVGTNETWTFEIVLSCDGIAAGDIKVALNAPASSAGHWGVTGPAAGVTGIDGNGVFRTMHGFTDSEVVALGLVVGNTFQVRIQGLLRTAGTSGNLQLRWAQNTSSGTATTVKTDSFLIATNRT